MLLDPFMEERAVELRLYKEYKEHGRLIVAYDFDNTVFDYHQTGATYELVINLLRKCYEQGHYMIVFSARENDKKKDMITFLKDHDIPFDIVNENAPFVPFNTRKIYYNILLDDRAGLASAYRVLSNVVARIKEDTREVIR